MHRITIDRRLSKTELIFAKSAFRKMKWKQAGTNFSTKYLSNLLEDSA